MSDKQIECKQFIHSCHIKGKFRSDVIVKEKIKYTDGTIEPNTVVFDNPKRCFYVTQNRFRHQYQFKPEYELISRLDRYVVNDADLLQNLAQVLGIFSSGYIQPDKLFKSPYVFGADIDVPALIKMRYMDQYPNANLEPTVGFLDIETSIQTNEIILISYMHDAVVHTAVLRSYLFDQNDQTRTAVPLEDLKAFVQSTLDQKAEELCNDGKHKLQGDTIKSLTYDIEVFDSEIRLIAWILKKVHESQTDFIQIWNLHFDIPRILETIQKYNCDPQVLFHNPNIPKKYTNLYYYGDQDRDVAHFTLRWPWLTSSCGSQFIDAMGLYSQCRRTAGFLDKYTLDSVLDTQLGLGKLPLVSGGHSIMQQYHFKEYVVYNIFDVVGLRFLEDKNKDILSMTILVGPTPVKNFATQTKRATNSIYHNLINKGMVLSSYSRQDDFLKLDPLFVNIGGSVLPPGTTENVGVNLSIV